MEKRILVIEDDSIVRDYLACIFKDNGHGVSLAGNITEGLDLAKRNKPDLITLDIELPGEWGPRFFYQQTQDPELKNIPVVVISGLSGYQCTIVKAAASISKPFDPDELLRIINEILNLEKADATDNQKQIRDTANS